MDVAAKMETRDLCIASSNLSHRNELLDEIGMSTDWVPLCARKNERCVRLGHCPRIRD